MPSPAPTEDAAAAAQPPRQEPAYGQRGQAGAGGGVLRRDQLVEPGVALDLLLERRELGELRDHVGAVHEDRVPVVPRQIHHRR